MKKYSAPSIKMMQMNMSQAILSVSTLSEKGATDVYTPGGLF